MMYDLSMVVFFVYEIISLIAETEKASTCFSSSPPPPKSKNMFILCIYHESDNVFMFF